MIETGLESPLGIIGGKDITTPNDYSAHIVGIYDVKAGAICTGSILSQSIVVTAAHCVESGAQFLRVVFGTDIESRSLTIRTADNVKVSPLWAFRQNADLNTGDIALIHFQGGLPEGYQPIRFLSDMQKLADGMTITLAGFGASRVVSGRNPRTGAPASDHQGAGKLRLTDTTILKAQYSKTEFTTDSSKGHGACHGDSGGPAFVTINGEMVLVGVTSRSVDDPSDTCAVSAAYTSLPFYAPWVVRTAKALDAIAGKTPAVIAATSPTKEVLAP